MNITKNRLWHLKIPKKPIGLIYVFGPGPAGAPLLPKSTNFTQFHQNGGEIPIFHLQTTFWGVKSQHADKNNKRHHFFIGSSNVREHHFFMEFNENSWKTELSI